MELCRHCLWSESCGCFDCEEDTKIVCLIKGKHVEKDDCCDQFEEEKK
jgi:hypothetical protein